MIGFRSHGGVVQRHAWSVKRPPGIRLNCVRSIEMCPATTNSHKARGLLRLGRVRKCLVVDGCITGLLIRVPCSHNVSVFVIALLTVRLQGVLRPEDRRWSGT